MTRAPAWEPAFNLLVAKITSGHFKAGRGSARAAIRKFLQDHPQAARHPGLLELLTEELNKAFPTASRAGKPVTPTSSKKGDAATFEKLYAQALERHWPNEDEAHAAVKELNDSLSDRQRRVLHMNIRKSYAQRTATPPAAAQVTVTAQSRREVQRYELVRMIAPMVVQAAGRRNAATKEKGASPQVLAKFSVDVVDNILNELYKKS